MTETSSETPRAHDARREPGFWERYRQLFNRRGSDFWSIVFGYPVGRLLVLLILPFSWITPTLLTVVGFACKLGAAALLWRADLAPLVWVVVLLQAAQVLDSMDGTLARARQSYSLTGAFLDKVTDALGLLAIAAALGWRAAHETGQLELIPLGFAGGAAFLMLCYMYWIVHAVRVKDADAGAISGGAPSISWAGIGREWLRGFTRIVRFSEADLYLWIALGAIFDLWAETVYLLCLSQGLTLVKRFVDHVRWLHRVDHE